VCFLKIAIILILSSSERSVLIIIGYLFESSKYSYLNPSGNGFSCGGSSSSPFLFGSSYSSLIRGSIIGIESRYSLSSPFSGSSVKPSSWRWQFGS
jgi:hypothetical protein